MIRLSGAPSGTRRELSVGIVVEQLRRPVPGGIGTYALGLLRGLEELGDLAPPQLLVASRPAVQPDPLAGLGPVLETFPLPGSIVGRGWSLGLFGLSGYRLVHSTGLDVPPTDCPLVVTVHDLLWRELPEAYGRHGRRWHDAALRRAARRAAAFVVPSDEVRDALAAALRGGRRIAVIEEGVDGRAEPDPVASTALLNELGVAGPYLLAVGTLEPRKNLSRLVQAYGAARERLAGRPSLVICGPEGWGSLGVDADTPGIVFTGSVPDSTLSGLYAGAVALAHVSLGEGFGLPVVEAMAAGLPVVAGRVPAAGEAALPVDPLDVAAIADALVEVCGNPETRRRLIEAGHQRVSNLSWRRAAEQHLELWDEVAPPR